MPPCANAAMCGGEAGDRRFCEPCSALVACRQLRGVGAGECGVCYESTQLYSVPMCNKHALCAACMRHILLGGDDVPVGAAALPNYIRKNIARMLHQQQCPFCRAVDTTPVATQLRAMRAHNRGDRGALLTFVMAGLELIQDSAAAGSA